MKRIVIFLKLLRFRFKRAEFYRDLAEMFRRSEPMLSFLEGEALNANQTGQGSKMVALQLIFQRFRSGENAGRLGYLLESVMPRSDAMMLVAVDRSADKSEALEALASAIDQQTTMMRVMLGYAAMPLAMLPLCYVLIRVFSEVIISISKTTPDFIQEELWRGFNGVAKVIAEFTVQYGPPVLALFILSVVSLVWSLPRWKGFTRLRFDAWPVFSMYRDFQAGLLLTSLAMLLKTGGTLKGAIEDISQSSSRWLRWHLFRVLRGLEDNPNAVVEAFSRGLLSPHLLSRAATLKRSAPTFSDVLIELGTKEGPRVLARMKATAFTANVAIVGVLVVLVGIMGVASMTVPGNFSTLMQPGNSMTLKAAYVAKRAAQAPALSTSSSTTSSPTPSGGGR